MGNYTYPYPGDLKYYLLHQGKDQEKVKITNEKFLTKTYLFLRNFLPYLEDKTVNLSYNYILGESPELFVEDVSHSDPYIMDYIPIDYISRLDSFMEEAIAHNYTTKLSNVTLDVMFNATDLTFNLSFIK